MSLVGEFLDRLPLKRTPGTHAVVVVQDRGRLGQPSDLKVVRLREDIASRREAERVESQLFDSCGACPGIYSYVLDFSEGTHGPEAGGPGGDP